MSDGSAQPVEHFRCDVSRNNGSDWVRPAGDLDLDTVHRVESVLGGLREEGAGNLVLDLRSLTFMDSTGLRLVIRWHTAAQEQGFRFSIVPGPEVVQRVFRLTGMDAHLPVAEAPDGA